MITELTNIGIGERRRGGFTLVELLVVIGIIALLASLGLVVAGQALGQSKRASTQATLQSMGTALETFKNDHGDYPPLITRLENYSGNGISAPSAITTPEILGEKARLASPGNLAGARTATRDEYRYARWMSEWTPAAYLLGVGDLNGDGDTDKDLLDLDDGKEGFGSRAPGELMAWTRIEGSKLIHEPTEKGKPYGPYVDAGAIDGFIERVPVKYDNTSNRIVTDGSSDQYLYRIVDSWGNPIRYYRNWQTKDPMTERSSVDFAPVELRSFEGLSAQFENDSASGDLGIDAPILRAPYMLLSAGAAPVEYAGSGDVELVSPFGDRLPGGEEGSERLYRFQETDGSFGSAFNPFDIITEAGERSDLLKMFETNVRYTP